MYLRTIKVSLHKRIRRVALKLASLCVPNSLVYTDLKLTKFVFNSIRYGKQLWIIDTLSQLKYIFIQCCLSSLCLFSENQGIPTHNYCVKFNPKPKVRRFWFDLLTRGIIFLRCHQDFAAALTFFIINLNVYGQFVQVYQKLA